MSSSSFDYSSSSYGSFSDGSSFGSSTASSGSEPSSSAASSSSSSSSDSSVSSSSSSEASSSSAPGSSSGSSSQSESTSASGSSYSGSSSSVGSVSSGSWPSGSWDWSLGGSSSGSCHPRLTARPVPPQPAPKEDRCGCDCGGQDGVCHASGAAEVAIDGFASTLGSLSQKSSSRLMLGGLPVDYNGGHGTNVIHQPYLSEVEGGAGVGAVFDLCTRRFL